MRAFLESGRQGVFGKRIVGRSIVQGVREAGSQLMDHLNVAK